MGSVMNDLPDLLVHVSAKSRDLVIGASVHIYNVAATCLGHVSRLLVIIARSLHSAALTVASYYQRNQRSPRLISQLVQQMIYK